VSPAPIRTLVNTHSHPDHTLGNSLFGTATIVAHERTRTEVLAGFPAAAMGTIWEPVDLGDAYAEPPFLTYTDGVTVWVDDLRCEVRHVGSPAHTTNDSIVWIPERSVLYAGDLVFNGGTPFLLGGSIAGAIDVLTNVVAPLNPTTVVPGHGPVCGPEIFIETLAYLRFVQQVAADAHAAGATPLAAALGTDLGRFAAWTDPERIVGNLYRAYAELDGQPLGAPVDLMAALRDMVQYNGGAPLRCRA
jgi:cyclase